MMPLRSGETFARSTQCRIGAYESWAGLWDLIGEHVDLPSTRVKSGAVNPVGKLTSIVAGMMCGADCIDDANVLRGGGTPRVFDEVYAAPQGGARAAA